jgi:RNA polymerase sigma-70 factor (ECF subfamily)
MPTLETQLLENVREFTAFARKRLGDPELAADAVQESLLKALKSSDQLRDEENARAWFYRILRRTIIDLYRRRDARNRAAAELEREVNLAPDAEEEHMICGCIERVLHGMNPWYAELIRRIDLNEEPAEAVAAEMQISRNNLNVRLHRARQQLKSRLEENCRVCAAHGCLDCHCGSSQGAAV